MKLVRRMSSSRLTVTVALVPPGIVGGSTSTEYELSPDGVTVTSEMVQVPVLLRVNVPSNSLLRTTLVTSNEQMQDEELLDDTDPLVDAEEDALDDGELDEGLLDDGELDDGELEELEDGELLLLGLEDDPPPPPPPPETELPELLPGFVSGCGPPALLVVLPPGT